MASSWYSTAAQTMGSGVWDSIANFFLGTATFVWDSVLTLVNIITPGKHVVTDWPEFVPRTATDSRSPCPALNALSNHGILPHDGRDITFKQMAAGVQKYYNCSPSLCYFVCNYMAGVLRRKYTDKLDLSDMCAHNGVEHDGSITRYDTIVQPDQSIPAEQLIHDLLAAAQNGKKLTAADLSRVLTTRWSHSKRTNGQFSLNSFHSAFGGGNAATLLLVLDGEIADIKPFLLEERIPQGWSTKVRSQMGLTMAYFNWTSWKILLGVDPSWNKTKKIA